MTLVVIPLVKRVVLLPVLVTGYSQGTTGVFCSVIVYMLRKLYLKVNLAKIELYFFRIFARSTYSTTDNLQHVVTIKTSLIK